MVKLTADLILQAAQYLNAIRDREIDLRGYKAPVIENLGVTLDQFDTIDLSDNEIRKLDGFPLLKRVKTLLINNNRISRIAEGLEESLPNLETLILTNNHLQELGDVDPLAGFKNLTSLSLLKNPISHKKHYRLYVVNKIPQLKLLDFCKVKKKERDEAVVLFKGKKGKQLEKTIGKKTKTFVPGAPIPNKQSNGTSQPKVDVQAIKEAISKAKTLEEVDRLTQLLKSGHIPGRDFIRSGCVSVLRLSIPVQCALRAFGNLFLYDTIRHFANVIILFLNYLPGTNDIEMEEEEDDEAVPGGQ